MLSCNGKHYMKAGTISLMLYVYNDPDDNLYDSYEIPVSDLYFYGDRFIEKVPEMPGFVLISNGTYSVVRDLSNLDDVVSNGSLINKSFGAAFVDTVFPNYTNRIDLADTVFNGLSYKHVRIVTEEDYSIFYINETDTVLPYSLSKQFDVDYDGILSRIDSYNYYSGKFYSLRMSFKPELPKTIYETFKSY
jgi:hypothetical protein